MKYSLKKYSEKMLKLSILAVDLSNKHRTFCIMGQQVFIKSENKSLDEFENNISFIDSF